MKKRNSIKIVRACFCGYLGFSLLWVLIELFLEHNWNQAVTQYPKLGIVIECVTYILARCDFEKFTSYFIIYGI